VEEGVEDGTRTGFCRSPVESRKGMRMEDGDRDGIDVGENEGTMDGDRDGVESKVFNSIPM
jgi:hypothetical protein